ncbi:MAG: STAS domain-containing protein [Ruminococcaceae bacterium]|nr:STAS domain-containing protein [Oscillospiraceae bacterium]MBE6901334.1 STAS domain-containing protein [Oscillospiraceae bacterium]
MTIDKKIENEVLTMKVMGRVDSSNSEQLEAAVNESIGGIKEFIWDMEGLEFISSAGLRVIINAQKTMNSQGKMKFINVNRLIMEVFDITGLVDIFTIE